MSQELKAKRYFLNEALDENVEHSEQGYVLYADYAQLERTNAALLGELKEWRANLYPRDHAKYCKASVKYPDWPDPKDDRCDLCKRTDAAIAEAESQKENGNG